MNPKTGDERVRDQVLLVVTTLSSARLATLSDAARHRAALAVLRVWGMEREWRAMYGSPKSVGYRMRRLLLVGVRRRLSGTSRSATGGSLDAQATVHLL